MPFARAEWTPPPAFESGKFHEPILLRGTGKFRELAGKITVIHRLHFASVVFRHIATLQNPITPQRRQTFVGIAVEVRIAPRPGAIINAHGLVGFHFAVKTFRRREFNFAHRHLHVGVKLARQIDTPGVGQLFAAVRLERIFSRDHKSVAG